KPHLPMTPSPEAWKPSPPLASAVDGCSVSPTVVSPSNSFVSSLMVFEQCRAVSTTGLPSPSQPLNPVEQAPPASPALTRYPAPPTRTSFASGLRSLTPSLTFMLSYLSSRSLVSSFFFATPLLL